MKHLTTTLLNILSFVAGCSVCMALFGKGEAAAYGFVGCIALMIASMVSECCPDIR